MEGIPSLPAFFEGKPFLVRSGKMIPAPRGQSLESPAAPAFPPPSPAPEQWGHQVAWISLEVLGVLKDLLGLLGSLWVLVGWVFVEIGMDL